MPSACCPARRSWQEIAKNLLVESQQARPQASAAACSLRAAIVALGAASQALRSGRMDSGALAQAQSAYVQCQGVASHLAATGWWS